MQMHELQEGQAQTINMTTKGFVMGRLSAEQLKPFIDEMNTIQNDFSKATPYNETLAGNLEHEYLVNESLKDYTFELVKPYVYLLNQEYGYLKDIKVLDKPCDEMLHNLWINFQQKYEFNPLHNHSGTTSFVIWLKVPFNMEDELAHPSSAKARMKCPGHFTFVHVDNMGAITQGLLPVDRSYEGMICVFPASLYHQVYPFYTSDEYRVSVSGNLCLKV